MGIKVDTKIYNADSNNCPIIMYKKINAIFSTPKKKFSRHKEKWLKSILVISQERDIYLMGWKIHVSHF